ncbi:YaiO family outer membrane beta-barrel protein [Flavobacterium sp.]|uniref:YaiO family outer membrane beta-barrel protein n=1 Tax=Flavobacterium sp. TaxID=239 RepID=UPI00260F771D|nr:YaiO family outer membrane beta-barrel protein [Flavobacterium sp.]
MKKNILYLYFVLHCLTLFSQQKEVWRDTIVSDLKLNNSIRLNYTVDVFKNDSPRHLTDLSYGLKTKKCSYILHYQKANRFNKNDDALEIESYPKLIKKLYAYVGGGFSLHKTLLPNYRFGSELFYNYSKGLESSLGMRYLEFNNSNVLIYTASFGKYYRNDFYTIRTYVTPKTKGTSMTVQTMARRYFRDKYHFASLVAAYGRGFTETGLEDYNTLTSLRFGAEFQHVLTENFYVSAQADWRRDELAYSIGDFENRMVLSTGLKLIF